MATGRIWPGATGTYPPGCHHWSAWPCSASPDVLRATIRDDVYDVIQAKEYLAQRYSPLEIGIQFQRMRNAAERLVKTEWARRIIPKIDALLRVGTLSGEEIAGLIG
jgi:hypothetical protein